MHPMEGLLTYFQLIDHGWAKQVPGALSSLQSTTSTFWK
jgi:hypothetical protein